MKIPCTYRESETDWDSTGNRITKYTYHDGFIIDFVTHTTNDMYKNMGTETYAIMLVNGHNFSLDPKPFSRLRHIQLGDILIDHNQMQTSAFNDKLTGYIK